VARKWNATHDLLCSHTLQQVICGLIDPSVLIKNVHKWNIMTMESSGAFYQMTSPSSNEIIRCKGCINDAADQFTQQLPCMCRKLHRDPRINSDFPQFFPKPICTGFNSRDPGAYPCQVAALVSAKNLEFLLSFSYLYWSVASIHAGLLFPTHSFYKCFYGLISTSYDIISN
jgi:hypothetical protein